MIDRQRAIAILQEHINTYRYQTTDKGWEQWCVQVLSETRYLTR